MCLERITDGVPRYIAYPGAITQIQVDKALVFSEGARNSKDFSVTDLKVAGKAWYQTLQTTVSAQPTRESGIVYAT